jgi:hypothetical protein
MYGGADAGRSPPFEPSQYGTYFAPRRLLLERRTFILKARRPRSESTMNIFYIIGVVVVIVVVAGFLGLRV